MNEHYTIVDFFEKEFYTQHPVWLSVSDCLSDDLIKMLIRYLNPQPGDKVPFPKRIVWNHSRYPIFHRGVQIIHFELVIWCDPTTCCVGVGKFPITAKFDYVEIIPVMTKISYLTIPNYTQFTKSFDISNGKLQCLRKFSKRINGICFANYEHDTLYRFESHLKSRPDHIYFDVHGKLQVTVGELSYGNSFSKNMHIIFSSKNGSVTPPRTLYKISTFDGDFDDFKEVINLPSGDPRTSPLGKILYDPNVVKKIYLDFTSEFKKYRIYLPILMHLHAIGKSLEDLNYAEAIYMRPLFDKDIHDGLFYEAHIEIKFSDEKQRDLTSKDYMHNVILHELNIDLRYFEMWRKSLSPRRHDCPKKKLFWSGIPFYPHKKSRFSFTCVNVTFLPSIRCFYTWIC